MRRVIFIFYFLRTSSALGGGGAATRLFFYFFFPCSADHERDWPPCKVFFFGLATNALNVRNNNNNNIKKHLIYYKVLKHVRSTARSCLPVVNGSIASDFSTEKQRLIFTPPRIDTRIPRLLTFSGAVSYKEASISDKETGPSRSPCTCGAEVDRLGGQKGRKRDRDRDRVHD